MTPTDAIEGPAIAAAVGFGIITAFQLAIALGAPLGRASWGGTHPGVLPARLRIASALAVVVWTAAALVVLGRAGLGPVSGEYVRRAAWVLVGVLVLGTLANAASKSRWERYFWAPFALAEAALVAIVAAG